MRACKETESTECIQCLRRRVVSIDTLGSRARPKGTCVPNRSCVLVIAEYESIIRGAHEVPTMMGPFNLTRQLGGGIEYCLCQDFSENTKQHACQSNNCPSRTHCNLPKLKRTIMVRQLGHSLRLLQPASPDGRDLPVGTPTMKPLVLR